MRLMMCVLSTFREVIMQTAGEVGSGWDVSLDDLEEVLQPSTFLRNRQMASVPYLDVVPVPAPGGRDGGDVTEVGGVEGDVQLTWCAFCNTVMHLFNR